MGRLGEVRAPSEVSVSGESGKGLEMNILSRGSQGARKLDRGEERRQTNQVERSRGRENKLLWRRKKRRRNSRDV